MPATRGRCAWRLLAGLPGLAFGEGGGSDADRQIRLDAADAASHQAWLVITAALQRGGFVYFPSHSFSHTHTHHTHSLTLTHTGTSSPPC